MLGQLIPTELVEKINKWWYLSFYEHNFDLVILSKIKGNLAHWVMYLLW